MWFILDWIELGFAFFLLIVEAVVRKLVSGVFKVTKWFSSETSPGAIELEIDCDRSTPQLISSRGFPEEHHFVTTEDGYILTLHRIPGGRKKNKLDGEDAVGGKKPVVFILHGFMQNSEVWVCREKPSDNLALVLAECGWDVWMGNVRGNKYSMKHLKFDPNKEEFWDFSLDEIIHQDIPAMLGYVREYTNTDKLSYIGFSQGTAVGFGAFSSNPKISKHINVFIALASTAKVLPFVNTVVQVVATAKPKLLFLMFGKKAFLPFCLVWRKFTPRALLPPIMETANYTLFNWDGTCIRKEEKPRVYAHLYSTSSVKSLVHWFQICCSGRFQMFDDTLKICSSNADTYYTNSVPCYPLSRISCPVVCFYGGRDTISDINGLLEELPKHTESFKEDNYEHLDFLFASDVNKKIFPQILESLEKYTPPPKEIFSME